MTAGSYRAEIEFQTEEMQGVATSTILVFLADDPGAARAAVVRWWDARNLAVPDYFHRVCAVSLSRYVIGVVEANGQCRTGQSWPLSEWKIDQPFAGAVWAQWRDGTE